MSDESGKTLYVVMPAYNEEKNIEQVVVSWAKVLRNGSSKSRIVVADSGSTDGTRRILLRLKKKVKQLEILEGTEQYHGPKVISLYKYAIEQGADYIFQTDSDGQTDPDEFVDFWNRRQELDGIIGYRKKREDGAVRAFVEKVVCLLLGIFFGVSVPDANAPFRLMKSSLVKKYIYRLPHDYAIPNVILTAYYIRFSEKILFRKVSFGKRTKGRNSINIKKIFLIGIKAFFSFFLFRRDMKILEVGSVKQLKNERRRKTVAVLCFALISFGLVVISPAFFRNSGNTMTDSSVFLTIGRQMKNGEVPYLDTFDHKGPLLYLINYFGLAIEDISGVFVFEFLAMFFALFFMHKIARIKISSYGVSITLAVLLFSPFIVYYLCDWGNLVEQYALPFISFSLYVFLKYFFNKKVSGLEIVLVGIAFASVVMLRANMIGIWVVFCIALLVKNIKEKRYLELKNNVLYFGIGAFVIIIPIIIWLFANGALWAFVDSYIRFNIEYSGGGINGILLSLITFMSNTIILLSLVLSIYYAVTEKKNHKMLLYLSAFIVVIVATCMSGRNYPHYGMTLVPMTIFPFAILFGDFERNNELSLVGIATVLLLVSLVYPSWFDVVKRLYKSGESDGYKETIATICRYIGERTQQDDRIIVYGNWNQIYVKCNRLPASRYSYQFPISEIRPSILDEFYVDLSINKPKVFVVQSGFMTEQARTFLREEGYIEEWHDNSDDGARVYFLNEDEKRVKSSI